jgi:hypothetical protein
MEIVVFVVGTTACLAVLGWMLGADGRKLRRFAAEVRARPPAPEEEFVSRHFRCEHVPDEVALRVRELFARFTGFPAENILPDDDFQAYLLGLEDDFVAALEDEFHITLPMGEAVQMRATVRSVALGIAAALQESSAE